ncbi:MAG TPA: hypothetical protein PLN69_03210 [bacterium]|nr:hypothetical protein [bacterium]
MEDKIRCPFCNFETPYPKEGKVHECIGECYSNYTLYNIDEDQVRTKMKTVEVFFLDDQYNCRITPDQLDEKCEFRTIPARESDDFILFAREKRVDEREIEKLKKALAFEVEIGVDTLERLHSSLERFERDMKDPDMSKTKLLNEIKVVEKIVQIIREKIELSI